MTSARIMGTRSKVRVFMRSMKIKVMFIVISIIYQYAVFLILELFEKIVRIPLL